MKLSDYGTISDRIIILLNKPAIIGRWATAALRCSIRAEGARLPGRNVKGTGHLIALLTIVTIRSTPIMPSYGRRLYGYQQHA